MSDWEENANRHAAELVRLTLKAAYQGAKPLPEDELAKLGMLIATERQLLIDSISGLLQHDEPEAADPLQTVREVKAFIKQVGGAEIAQKVAVALEGVTVPIPQLAAWIKELAGD